MDYILEDTLVIVGVLLGVFLFTFLMLSPIVYYSGCREAKIYNQQNGTDYTCGDFIWASEQINQQTQTIKLID